jgi:hypothetical protein
MTNLALTLHVLGLQFLDSARTKLTTKPERGSETIEKVLWAVAVIAIVGIVVTVMTNFVTTTAAKIA